MMIESDGLKEGQGEMNRQLQLFSQSLSLSISEDRRER
jgi:hypothetical protein